jgi:succinoglycan biosynthesis protein ExoM
MDRPENVVMCLIVADNDPAGSSREAVDTFRAGVPFPVHYRVEQRPGIPCARNNVLQQAATLGITDLAFIDDDEYVDDQWLVTLWSQYRRSGADVMAGHVITVYPPETPRWITQGQFYQNQKRQSNVPLTSAATNNVVFNFEKLVVQWSLLFDERFGLAGGSDSDFFTRAAKKGAIIQWTHDAIVYEVLAQERMRISYLLKNRFRKSNLKLGYADLTVRQKAGLFFGLLKKIICSILILPFSFFRGVSGFVTVLSRVVAAAANIMALAGLRIKWDEYHSAAMKNEKK